MSKKYNISLLPGDGTGPEVINEAVKVLNQNSNLYDIEINFTTNDLGGERYLKTGELVTENDIEQFSQADAVLLGAIGHPEVKPGILEQGILLKLRKTFDQYINLRPVVLYPGVETPLADKQPEDIDFVVVRENTEGLYAGAGGYIHYGTENEIATQESINSYYAIHRCIKYAFEFTKQSGRKKITLCAKTNVLTYAHDLWERIFYDVAKDYPEIETDYGHVDAVCMWMVKNQEWFDEVVLVPCCNMNLLSYYYYLVYITIIRSNHTLIVHLIVYEMKYRPEFSGRCKCLEDDHIASGFFPMKYCFYE